MTSYIDPINPYTGEVSILAILKNEKNGHNTFPMNMGETVGRICNCSLRTKLVGDGCAICNPERAKDLMEEQP